MASTLIPFQIIFISILVASKVYHSQSISAIPNPSKICNRFFQSISVDVPQYTIKQFIRYLRVICLLSYGIKSPQIREKYRDIADFHKCELLIPGEAFGLDGKSIDRAIKSVHKSMLKVILSLSGQKLFRNENQECWILDAITGFIESVSSFSFSPPKSIH